MRGGFTHILPFLLLISESYFDLPLQGILSTGIIENSSHAQNIRFPLWQSPLISNQQAKQKHSGTVLFCMLFTGFQPEVNLIL